MNILERITAFNTVMQYSFRNAVDAVERAHQTTAEKPLEMLKEFGFPEDQAELARESHKRILRFFYGGICNAHEEVGKLFVVQTTGLIKFVGDMAGGSSWPSPDERGPERERNQGIKTGTGTETGVEAEEIAEAREQAAAASQPEARAEPEAKAKE